MGLAGQDREDGSEFRLRGVGLGAGDDGDSGGDLGDALGGEVGFCGLLLECWGREGLLGDFGVDEVGEEVVEEEGVDASEGGGFDEVGGFV